MRFFAFAIFIAAFFAISLPISAKGNEPFAAWPVPGGGFVYITPNDETKLRVVDNMGKLMGSHVKEIGTGSMLMPWDIAGTPDGRLFVLDRMKATVNVYDEDFDYQYSIGEKGEGYGQLRSPRAIAIDARGFIYVASNGNNRIEKYDLEGNHKGTLEPESGEGVGTEFKYITAMAAAADGRLFVAIDSDDPSALRNLYAYNENGDLVSSMQTLKWGGEGTFNDIFVLDDGTLLITDTPGSKGGFAGAVWHVDPAGGLLGKYEAYDGDFDRYYSPVDVQVRDGKMYFFCAEKKCLVFDSAGGFLYSFGL